MCTQLRSILSTFLAPQNWSIRIWVAMVVLALGISLFVPQEIKFYLWVLSGLLVAVGIATVFARSSAAQEYPDDVGPIAVIIMVALAGGLLLISGSLKSRRQPHLWLDQDR
jgi:cbb3-type cytochrome oxidase subunit 1